MDDDRWPEVALPDSDGPLADVPRDGVLLIAGPPMTGKYRLLLAALARNADAGIVISTKHRAPKIHEDYRALVDGSVRVGVVDCVGSHEAVETSDGGPTTRRADSPENLTRIGVKFTELFEAFYEGGDHGHVGVGIHSLSQLLMHSEMRPVYQFLQVLIGQVRSAAQFGAAVVDDGVVDDRELRTLQQQFDGMIRTREDDDGRREFRVRGFGSGASPWTPF